MEETIEFYGNDTHREIGSIMEKLTQWDSELCDPRVRAIILIKLEEAQLWSLKLIKQA